MDPRIERFLASPAFGVAGASTNRSQRSLTVRRRYLVDLDTECAHQPGREDVETAADAR